MKISCDKVSKNVFAAICSTVQSNLTSIAFDIDDSVGSETWPWLVYAVCSDRSVQTSLTIQGATLTAYDVSTVADTLRYNYSQAGMELLPITHTVSEFGFVDILEGTAVWPIDFEEGEGAALVMSSFQRCRAWFMGDYLVEVLVPEFGRCRTRIGDGVSEISRDLDDQNTRVSNELSKLRLHFTSIDSGLSVVHLLELIGKNLRSLDLSIPDHSNDIILDLSVLAAVCPKLELLEIRHFGVVVTVHNEALHLWPIKALTIEDKGR
ncbi:hypothetical protein V7S43_018560 [Phytophthora oleae]|uniref:Uncharacterized protein n=1 Tax=Phytophthora oleae TaxID=2107226 RepID=A0ABD3ETH7_9STRA